MQWSFKDNGSLQTKDNKIALDEYVEQSDDYESLEPILSNCITDIHEFEENSKQGYFLLKGVRVMVQFSSVHLLSCVRLFVTP